jgi:hypothetical protein
LEKYRSQEVASTNLRKDILEIIKIAFCSVLAFVVLEKKIFIEFAVFTGIWPKFDLEMKDKVKSQT